LWHLQQMPRASRRVCRGRTERPHGVRNDGESSLSPGEKGYGPFSLNAVLPRRRGHKSVGVVALLRAYCDASDTPKTRAKFRLTFPCFGRRLREISFSIARFPVALVAVR